MPQGRVPSVDASRYTMVPRADVPRSAFDVRHGHKTTFNAGVLVPLYVDEVLPGDSLRMNMTAFCRLSTPLFPMMDNLEFESWFFFVPYRLVWSNWERFMGEKTSPSDSTNFLTPYTEVNNANLTPGASMADYMGVTNNGSGVAVKVCSLPFRAYQLIVNDWFLDTDIDVPYTVRTGDGPDVYAPGTAEDFILHRPNKRKDYFTSARPWPQQYEKTDTLPASMPYNDTVLNEGFPNTYAGFFRGEGIGAPVIGLGTQQAVATAGPWGITETGARLPTYGAAMKSDVSPFFMRSDSTTNLPDVRVLVNDIRTAVMVQAMMERSNRGGTRYTELIRSHFGVQSPDARLQRPELLGGGRTMIHVNPVAQTSASGVAGTTTKLGELAAIGTGQIYGHGFSSSFTEHGVLIGLGCVRSFLTYQQGNERMWNRRSKYDFYWPGLAHLGEQAILSQEIYADGSASDVAVFGYQNRWDEYRWKASRTSGYFRSTVATPLDAWHLGQKFTARPVLNTAFIEENPPVSRVLQVSTNFGEDFLFDALFDARWVRPMPMFSLPGVGVTL